MLRTEALTLLLVVAGVAPCAAEWTLHGHVTLQGGSFEAPESWRDGGWGKLDSGLAPSDDEAELAGRVETELGLFWEPSLGFDALLHVAGEVAEPERLGDRPAGLVQLRARWRLFPSDGHEIRTQLGTFYLPTTFEAVDVLWSSPYSISLSSLSTWLAEEVRPTGLSLEWILDRNGWVMSLGGMALGGTDTAGALLAWRGWSWGSRRSRFGETLPLPAQPSLQPGGLFGAQLEGTEAFGEDLDGRVGWAAWARLAASDRFSVQASRYDNRGDRELYEDQYAWRTRFDHLGLDWQFVPEHGSGQLSLAMEWMAGDSGMGIPPAFADVAFDTWYLIASWSTRHWRLTGRLESGAVEDRARAPETTRADEEVESALLGLMWFSGRWQLSAEWLRVDTVRPGLAALGLPTASRADLVLIDLRILF